MAIDEKRFFTFEDLTTPPMGSAARRQAGYLLRALQQGESFSMPVSRPMPSIGKQCHELRLLDDETGNSWRIIYYLDDHFVVVLDYFKKKTQTTPQKFIDRCQGRLKRWSES